MVKYASLKRVVRPHICSCLRQKYPYPEKEREKGMEDREREIEMEPARREENLGGKFQNINSK